jgi:hypothetical protein
MKLYRKNSILEEKNSGQKSIILAHSGGHNLVKIRFCLFFSHYGSKSFCNMPDKLVQIDRILEKVKKIATMGRYLEKALQILF